MHVPIKMFMAVAVFLATAHAGAAPAQAGSGVAGERSLTIRALDGGELGQAQLAAGESIRFSIHGAGEDTRVMALPNSVSGLPGDLSEEGGYYRFTAPQTGAFAGSYTVQALDPRSESATAEFHVGLSATVNRDVLVPGGDSMAVTISGAIPGYGFGIQTTASDATLSQRHGVVPVDDRIRSIADETAANPAVAHLNATHSAEPGHFQLRLVPEDGRYEELVLPDLGIAEIEMLSGWITDGQGQAISGAHIQFSQGSDPFLAVSQADGRFQMAVPRDDAPAGTMLAVTAAGMLPSHAKAARFQGDQPVTTLMLDTGTASVRGTVSGLHAQESVELHLLYEDGGTMAEHGPYPVNGSGDGEDAFQLDADHEISYSAVSLSGLGFHGNEYAPASGITFSGEGDEYTGVELTAEPTTPSATVTSVGISNPQGTGARLTAPNATVSITLETGGRAGTFQIIYGTDPEEQNQAVETSSYQRWTEFTNVNLTPLECGTTYHGQILISNDRGIQGEIETFDFTTGRCAGSEPSTFSCAMTGPGGDTRMDPLMPFLLLISALMLIGRRYHRTRRDFSDAF